LMFSREGRASREHALSAVEGSSRAGTPGTPPGECAPITVIIMRSRYDIETPLRRCSDSLAKQAPQTCAALEG
jgi:hypothetical protein